MKYFWGLREVLSVSLIVGPIFGQNMVGIAVVRGAEIFPWKIFPVRPNHVITATKATTATNRKTIIIRYFLSGIGDNSADGTRLEIKRSGSSGSYTAYYISCTGTSSSLVLLLPPPPFSYSSLSECSCGGEKRGGISPEVITISASGGNGLSRARRCPSEIPLDAVGRQKRFTA